MTERPGNSKGFRKHIREVKAAINQELGPQESLWAQIETKLIEKFGITTIELNRTYLYDYFATRTRILDSTSPLTAQEPEISAFQQRHPNSEVRIANAPITKEIIAMITTARDERIKNPSRRR